MEAMSTREKILKWMLLLPALLFAGSLPMQGQKQECYGNRDGGIHQVWKGEDGKVYIDTSSEAMSIHEITHVKQSLESGGLEFSEGGQLLNAGIRAPMRDRYAAISQMEVDAYRMQYSFDCSFPGRAKSLNDINAHSVGNIGNGMIYEAIRKYSKYLELKELLSE